MSMKTLYVIRHAKSSWEDADLADFDRPLNERGKMDAPRMGKRLKERKVYPNLILSSPARRAFSTAKRMAEVLGYGKENIRTDSKLYHAGSRQIISVLKSIPEKHEIVMIFGHNPGLTDFVNEVGKDVDIDNIPTAGVAALQFQFDSWSHLETEQGKLLFFDYPKSRKD
jgi:phosphohistidine phosphatase